MKSGQILFLEAMVSHLPRMFSDHKPILNNFYDGQHRIVNNHFRFETIWTMHDGLEDMICMQWNPNTTIHTNLTALAHKLQRWNIKVLANIFKAKRTLLTHIDVIQSAEDYTTNHFLHRL